MTLNKPTLIDSHCHLHSIDLTCFEGGLDEVMRLAYENGVTNLLCVSVELDDISILYRLADQYKSIRISVGIHPNVEMKEDICAAQLIEFARHPACIAIGETGLDYYRTESALAREHQQTRFREHIRAAISTSKPLIIHTREAAEDTLRLMAEENAQSIGGVMHCFAEDWEIAKRALDLNFYISFSGIVSFKNAINVQEVAKKVPFDRLLIETDAPYLAPVPFRGKQNHPALVKHVAEALSALRQIDYETLAAQTTANFYQCFKTSPSPLS